MKQETDKRLSELKKDIKIVTNYINNKMTFKERSGYENLRQLLLINYLRLKEVEDGRSR